MKSHLEDLSDRDTVSSYSSFEVTLKNGMCQAGQGFLRSERSVMSSVLCQQSGPPA
jgi:hypothetical protein